MPTYFMEEATRQFERHVSSRNTRKYGKLNASEALQRLSSIFNSIIDEHNYLDDDLFKEEVQRCLSSAIEDDIKEYTKSKGSLSLFYQDFVTFIKEQVGIELTAEFRFDYAKDTLSRQLEIIKMLHGHKLTSEEIANRLGITPGAARTYLREMTSANPDEGLILQGEKVRVEFDVTKHVYSCSNTIHPLIITGNVRQTLALLDGLFQVKQSHPKYAESMASNIWSQLSDHCKKHIHRLHLSVQMVNWLNMLEDRDKAPIFQSEDEIYRQLELQGQIDIVYFFKSGRRCNIELYDGDEVILISKCKVLAPLDETHYYVRDETGMEHHIDVSLIKSTKRI